MCGHSEANGFAFFPAIASTQAWFSIQSWHSQYLGLGRPSFWCALNVRSQFCRYSFVAARDVMLMVSPPRSSVQANTLPSATYDSKSIPHAKPIEQQSWQ